MTTEPKSTATETRSVLEAPDGEGESTATTTTTTTVDAWAALRDTILTRPRLVVPEPTDH